jgi:dTDP-4-dehydrorhamnose reductase
MKINKKVLITGCGGMLGEAVYELFNNKYSEVLATDIDLNRPWLSYLDVRELKECEAVFEKFNPEIVLHLAALTDLEYCENNKENSWLTNALGPENIALLCEKYNSTMVYISTAGIFGGEQDVYNDFDAPNPLSIYAKSKYYGELFVLNRLAKAFVFRAGWMMGGGVDKDKKFINKLYKQLVKGQKEIFVVDDKLGTPTYTHDFANGIFNVIQTNYYGLYNQVCNGSCSRYDVALELINLLNLENKIKVTKVDSDYFKDTYFAPRPYSEKLVNLKLNKRGINFMRDWKVCLEEYSKVFIEDIQKNGYNF